MKKILLLFAVLLIPLSATADGTAPASGTGTESDPYLITSASDLYWFADFVNKSSGTTLIYAKLTNDIDYSDFQTMIGTSDHPYCGTFDGQGHKITLKFNTSNQGAALFSYIGGSTTIKNLSTTGNIYSSANKVGGIVGVCKYGITLENLFSDVVITSYYNGDSSIGGLVAEINGSSTLLNCGFAGNMVGTTATCCGGLVGWLNCNSTTMTNCYVALGDFTVSTSDSKTFARGNTPTLTNCYYTKTLGDAQGTQIANTTSGELCYALNGNKSTGTLTWYQKLGTDGDAFPCFDSTRGIVYGGRDACPFDVSSTTAQFSNQTHDKSETTFNEDGLKLCKNTNCKAPFEWQEVEVTDNWYVINNTGNLKSFADKINNGTATTHNAKLTNDIDYRAFQTMIGTSNHPYCGVFNGQNHKITINFNTANEVAALFRYTGVKGATVIPTIQYLTTSGSICSSEAKVGGVAGVCNNGLNLYYVTSDVTITSYYDGDASIGGLAAEIYNTASYFTCCGFSGKMLSPDASNKTTGCGGLVGWFDNMNFTLSSCYFVPSQLTVSTNDGATFARGSLGQGLTNCFYTKALDSEQGAFIGADEVSNGGLCYKLNGGKSTDAEWRQNLSGTTVDALPVWDNTHAVVYGGYEACGAQYSNTKHTVSGEETDYVDGCLYCATCGRIGAVKSPTGDGTETDPYQIASKGNFVWFAEEVNSGTNSINAKLTADLDFRAKTVNEKTYAAIDRMVGTPASPFKGTFDGNGKTVTLAYNTSAQCAGLFAYLYDGTVKDITTQGTLQTSAGGAGGIVGCMDGEAKLLNTKSSVALTCSLSGTAYCGGLVGAMKDESAVSNSVFTGSLLGTAAQKGGLLAGYSSSPSNTISRCYVAPASVTMQDIYPVIASDCDAKVKNCFYFTEYAAGKTPCYGTYLAASTISSGELCWKLNDRSATDQTWFQTLGNSGDAAPVLDNTHAQVYGDDDACPAGSGYTNTTHTYTSATTEYDNDGIAQRVCEITDCSGKTVYKPAEWNDNDKVYYITNKGNLIWYANSYNSGDLGYSDSAKLTADIDLGDNQTMIGTEEHPYISNFEGDYHTITVHYNTINNYAGLFSYLGCDEDEGKVSDLKVSGTIKTSARYAGGIAGNAYYDYIDNCQSDVTINSTYPGAAYHGGIVGYGNYCSIYNCLFNGQFIGEGTSAWGGILGQEGPENINSIDHSLFAPSKLEVNAANSSTIMKLYSEGEDDSDTDISDCYYLTALGSTENATASTAEDAKDGTLCNKLDIYYWIQDHDLNLPIPFRKLRESNLAITDDTKISAYAGYYISGNANYTRSIASTTNYGTLCLPYDIKSVESKYQLYTLSGTNTSTLYFEPVDEVKANTPCLFKKLVSTDESVVFSADITAIDYYTDTPSYSPATDLTMKATYTSLTDQTGMYFIAQDKFWKADAAITIKPFRGWIEASLGARTMTIMVDGETDAVLSLDAEGNLTEEPVYNLAGQKLTSPQKGQINIIGNKKVVRLSK